jgi:hypothetical protein
MFFGFAEVLSPPKIGPAAKMQIGKSQKVIRELPHLRKVRKSNKFGMTGSKFADVRFAELVCGPLAFDNRVFMSYFPLKIKDCKAQTEPSQQVGYKYLEDATFVAQYGR